jgi:clan AA aspartic protease
VILGEYRDGHPRATVKLLGPSGAVEIEFIVDTGFEGDLALPGSVVRQLGARPAGFRSHAVAGGARMNCPCYTALVEWDNGPKPVEVLVLEGNPLLGTTLLDDHLLQVEVTTGGDVIIGPL